MLERHPFESVLANVLLGPLLGAVLAAYAYGLWTLKPWVAPLSIVHAFHVPLNLVLFWYRNLGPEIPPLAFILGYLAIAFTGSAGRRRGLTLTRHSPRLRATDARIRQHFPRVTHGTAA